MDSSKIDAIISAWEKEGETLPYSQIKQYLVERGVISKTNDRSLSRWLKKLVQEGTLKKSRKGYYLAMKPKEYQVFDYVNELREKYSNYVYEGEVGGFISYACAFTYLNFDEALLHRLDERLAFDTISVRLGELFEALFMLRNDLIKRRCGLSNHRLNDIVVRETLFALLNRSIGEHHATEELVKKYLRYLRAPEKRAFKDIWESNRPRDFNQVDSLGEDFFFDSIEQDPEINKKILKADSLDIEKYSIKELIDKYARITEKIEQKYKNETQEEFGYTFTQEESELEHKYRMAIHTKIFEGIKALNTSMEDFGIIITRHPRTMNQYFTPEHILYEAMKWACEPPEEQFLRKLWQEHLDEEKTFEGMVADRLSIYNNINPRIIKSLGSKPWVKRKLSKFGSFDEILRLYIKKYKQRKVDRAKSSREFLKGIKELQKEKQQT